MRSAWPYIVGAVAFLALAPLLAVLRQVTILLAGAGLSWAAHLTETHLLLLLPIDPVYGGAGLRVLGGIDPYGLALAGSVGWWLHHLLPAVFSDPVLVADGAAVSALVESGMTVLARLLTAILATSLLVTLVWWLAKLGARRWAHPALGVTARLGQVWLLLDLAHEADLSLRDLEATGLPFALAAFAPVDRHGQRLLLTTQLEQAPVALVTAGNALVAIASCLLLAWLLAGAGRGAWWLVCSYRTWRLASEARSQGQSRARPLTLPWWRLAARWPHLRATRLPSPGALARVALLLGLPVLLSLSPLHVLAEGEIATLSVRRIAPDAGPDGALPEAWVADVAQPADAPPVAVSVAVGEPATRITATAPTAGTAPADGGRVVLEGSNYRYTLRVEGRPWVVRGMGYNPWYADLPAEERRALYRRDFSLMRETGVNTVEGWFQGQFDEVTLDEARRQGLKVIMPFELNQDYDYTDPAVQARFRSEVTDWVLRYRDHPAVLMWGPGNEVLHRLIFPTAVQGQRDPGREQRADDFARFYVELMDLVHQLDPHHPVIYRDAEDLYLARFRAQLQQRPVERPWFVYGTNVYTSRIAEVIQKWPSQGIDAPLLVSEFSPGGSGAAERPVMLGWYWSTIRAHPERVLGGVVYTWATRGPEDLDRVFGLTNEAGVPVDGSLGALRQLFRPANRPPLTTQGAPPPAGRS